MSDWDDVRRMALALPETDERVARGNWQWRVREKLFVWERPLRPTDLQALGAGAPTGAVLGARVEDLGEKEALLAEGPGVFFTIPHFDGYLAVLVQLGNITVDRLEQLVAEAWAARAPGRLAQQYLGRA